MVACSEKSLPACGRQAAEEGLEARVGHKNILAPLEVTRCFHPLRSE